VGKSSVMEKNWFEEKTGAFVRQLQIVQSGNPLTALLCEMKGNAQVTEDKAVIRQGDEALIVQLGGFDVSLASGANKTLLLKTKANKSNGNKLITATVRLEHVTGDLAKRGMSSDH